MAAQVRKEETQIYTAILVIASITATVLVQTCCEESAR
jgi:hypothetical protein